MLILDIGTFAKDYPDASEAQILALLAVRGDLNKAEAKDLVPDEVANASRAPKTRSIFSLVQLTSVASTGSAAAVVDASAVAGAGSAMRGAVERAVERTKEVAATSKNPLGDHF